MKTLATALKALATVAGLAGLMAPTDSQAVVLAEQSFDFYGTCSDCTLNSAPGAPIATVVLAPSYALGAPITVDDIISFSYVGSNLVDPYTVTGGASGGFAEIYLASGALNGSAAPQNFTIDFIDGLGFHSGANGTWYTCGIGPAGFYSGSCSLPFNNDIGTGSWNAPAVPEPAAWGLMALGLAALSLRRRPA